MVTNFYEHMFSILSGGHRNTLTAAQVEFVEQWVVFFFFYKTPANKSVKVKISVIYKSFVDIRFHW